MSNFSSSSLLRNELQNNGQPDLALLGVFRLTDYTQSGTLPIISLKSVEYLVAKLMDACW